MNNYRVNNAQAQQKQNGGGGGGVNSRFASVSDSEILKIQEDAVPENTKAATQFGMKVFHVQRFCK